MTISDAIQKIAMWRGCSVEDAEYLFNERVGIKTDGNSSPAVIREASRQAFDELTRPEEAA